MTILEHPEAQAILDGARFSVAQLEEMASQLEPFLGRYLPLFRRSEQRDNARHVLEGKLSSLSRKTSEPIAHHAGVRRENLQDFVGSSPWDDRAVLDEIRTHVIELWADPDAVLAGDGSGFAKKGEHSCGVKRQYCGRLGKVENCQVGIFLAYACRYGHTLLDHRLFLPKEWADDPRRREKAKVPHGVAYQETWEILLGLIDANKEVPHAWVAADSEFGRINKFREGLRQRGERYVVDVREDLRLRDLSAGPPQRRSDKGPAPSAPAWTSASAWAQARPAGAWQRYKIRDGEKRPLLVEATETWVETLEDMRVAPAERFVVVRTVDRPAEEAKTWHCLSNAGEGVPLGEVVKAHARRYWEEDSLGQGKGEVGMAQYEVRSWVGWHHHMTLTLLALWFLVLEQKRASKKRRR
jgi:SRSO17 transposase